MKRIIALLLVFVMAGSFLPVRSADTANIAVVAVPTDGVCSLYLADNSEPTATLDGLAGEVLTVETDNGVYVQGDGWAVTAPATEPSVLWAVATLALPCAANSVTVTAGWRYTVKLSFAELQPEGRVVTVAYPVPSGTEIQLRADDGTPQSGPVVRVLRLTGVINDRVTVLTETLSGTPDGRSVAVEVFDAARYQTRWAEGRKTAGCSGWAADNLQSALLLGLVPGDLARDWQKPITRLEFCRVVVCALETLTNRPVGELMAARGVSPNPKAFTDSDHPAVLACHALGIVSGKGDGTFAPDETLNRAYAAGFLGNIAKTLGEDTTAPAHGFQDSGLQPWMTPSLNYVKAKGIMNGLGGGLFGPLDLFSREQATGALLNFTLYCFWRAYGAQAVEIRARMFKHQEYLNFPYTGVYRQALEASAEVCTLVNAERAAAGVAPLERDLPLTILSMLKCQDMYERSYFAHESPTYGTVGDMMMLLGVTYGAAGEVLAGSVDSPRAAVDAWMNSPDHRAALLSVNYTEMGAGVSWSSDRLMTRWSQTFWR